MNKLIKLVILYQKDTKNEIFKEIVESLTPMIRSFIKSIPILYQDDVYQEIIMLLDKAIKKFKTDNINIDYKYLDNFKIKYPDIESNLDYEYRLFCKENQLINYFKKICNSCINDFYRQNKIKHISLNQKNKNQIELLDLIKDNEINEFSLYETYDLLEEEYQLLCLMLNKNKYTQKQIGQILGISQQAVNKRIQKLRKKLKK